MNWVLKLLEGIRGIKKKDPVIVECANIASINKFHITRSEWNTIHLKRTILTNSELGGIFVDKRLFDILCYFILFDGLFHCGIEQLREGKTEEGINSLEKAKTILPWPTVLFALGHVFVFSGKLQHGIDLLNSSMKCFDSRSHLLDNIFPNELPNRA